MDTITADMNKNRPTDTPPDYGLFSILFLHEERYKPMIHQGTLRYFSEKNPERPSGVRFFFREIPCCIITLYQRIV